MATKDNHHPLVKELRGILKRRGLSGALLVAITPDGDVESVTAGSTVGLCNAFGPVLDEREIAMIEFAMFSALDSMKP